MEAVAVIATVVALFVIYKIVFKKGNSTKRSGGGGGGGSDNPKLPR